jgi:hypothetical protein
MIAALRWILVELYLGPRVVDGVWLAAEFAQHTWSESVEFAPWSSSTMTTSCIVGKCWYPIQCNALCVEKGASVYDVG